MRQNVVFFLFFIFILVSISKDDRKVHLQRRDATILINTLLAKEGKIDIHVSEDSVIRTFDRLVDSLETPRSYIELYKLFGSSVSTIQCGHTDIQISRKVFLEWVKERNSLPIDYVLVGKKLFANELDKNDVKYYSKFKSKSKTKTKDETIPKNSEIIAIDGKSVEELMGKMSTYIPSDENLSDFRYFKIASFFEFYRSITNPKKDSVEVIFSKKRDTSRIMLPIGVPPIHTLIKRVKKLIALEVKNKDDFGKFSILKSKYAYFKFLSFKESRGKKYSAFLEKSFKQIRDKKLDKLIVDVRGNLGGQMQIELMSYFVGPKVYLGKYELNKPYQKYRNKYISKWNDEFRNHKKLTKSYAKIQKKLPEYSGEIFTPSVNSELVYKGQIIVITDEGSFSASSILACHLKTLCNAKIAGQVAGGSFYKGNSGTLKVKLPYTDFTLLVNPNTFYTNIQSSDNSNLQEIKIPDYFMEPLNPKSKKKETWYLSSICKLFDKSY
jgi:C-terminal processing protease CtpA/Prc